MIIFNENYLYGFKTDSINNKKLVDHCLRIEQTLIKNFSNIDPDWYGNMASAHNHKYNLLTFPGEQLNKLYYELVKHIPELLEDKCYVLKSWLNVFRKGQKVDWHPHWPPDKGVWHGFYCAQVGNSFTEYRIPEVTKNIKVKSEEGLIVVGKSAGDEHSSSRWTESQRPRVTIAFDIIPIESLSDDLIGNHFIPFKP
jgi:hypothetical protein|tara:strand:- start:4080 stop:4670 length:591 start_codon:yes stop_codon:yes gene_type:complete